jgi:hypothetical protein
MLRIYPTVSVRLQVEAELARRRAATSSTNGEGPNAQGKVRS